MLSTIKTVVNHQGDGVTRVFSYNFRVPKASHLKVFVYDSVAETKTEISQSLYDITGLDSDVGGTVTYPRLGAGSPLDNTKWLIILRVIPYTQDTELPTGSGFQPKAIEYQLDLVVMQIQQVAEELSRAVTLEDLNNAFTDQGQDIIDAAAASVAAAAASATAAGVSANNAASEADDAALSETNATNSATAASASATAAAGSASAASASETNAAASASAAATSATNSGNSATAAASSAAAALTSENNAATSASNAATSASGAATSATNAGNSASAASTSATNAANSATAAATSAAEAAATLVEVQAFQIFDADAQAIITALPNDNLTSTQQLVLQAMVQNLKRKGLWTKLDVVGCARFTEELALLNLKNPTGPASTKTGDVTHTAGLGWVPGTGSSRVNLGAPLSSLVNFAQDSNSGGVYVENNVQMTQNCLTANDGVSAWGIRSRRTDDFAQWVNNSLSNDISFASTDARGHWAHVRTSSTASELFHNGLSVDTNTITSTGVPTTSVYVAYAGSATVSFWHFGAALSAQEFLDLYNIFEAVRALSVDTIIDPQDVLIYDPNAQAIRSNLTSALTLNDMLVIQNAIQQMKAEGIWSKLDIFGSAWFSQELAKMNWLDPSGPKATVTTTTFSAGVGWVPAGGSVNLQVALNSLSNLAQNNAHYGGYFETNVSSANPAMTAGTTGGISLAPRSATDTFTFRITSSLWSSGGASTNSIGHFMAVRTAAAAVEGFKNGVSVGTDTEASEAVASDNIGIARIDSAAISHWHFGASLTATEVAALYTIIEGIRALSAVGAVNSSDITDSGTVGRAVLQSDTTSAARNALGFSTYGKTLVDLANDTALANEIRISDYTDYGVVDLRKHLAVEANHRDALVAAFAELWDATGYNKVLNCYGIQLDIHAPILLKDVNSTSVHTYAEKVLNNAGNVTDARIADKIINDLNIRVVTNGYTWQASDFVFSIAGKGAGTSTQDIRRTIFNHPMVDMNDHSNLVGFHASGYYHLTLNHYKCRRLSGTGIGFYSSRYEAECQILSYATAPSTFENENHGIYIHEPDIVGVASGLTENTIGIYLEDGDAVIQGGWTSYLGTGLFSNRGGFNIQDHHFSIGGASTLQRAIVCTAPRTISIENCETDGCGVHLSNPTNNAWTPGTSLLNWSNIKIHGNIKSSGTAAGNSTMRGLVTFNAVAANTYCTDLAIDYGWMDTSAATNTPLVAFCSDGVISNTKWIGASFSKIRYRPANKNGNSGLAGVFPPEVLINLTRTDAFELDWDPEFGAIYLRNLSAAAGNPYIRPGASNQLRFGRKVSDTTETDYWEIDNSGNLKPAANNTYAIGDSNQGIKNLYAGATMCGIVETGSLTTTPGGASTVTITATGVTGTDIVLVNAKPGSMSAGRTVIVGSVKPGTNQISVDLFNGGGAAFNGTALVSYVAIKPTG